MQSHISWRAIAYYAFLAFVFFPYIQLFPAATDQQPFAVLFAMGLFFLLKKRFTSSEVLLLLMLIAAFFILLSGPKTFVSLRSFANYLSLFFIPYATYRVLRSGMISLGSFLWLSFSIWFSVSIIQAVVYSEFLTFVIGRSSTTVGRGVTGLAPEPTFLGLVFLFYILFALHVWELRYRTVLIALSTIGIVLLAKSSMAVLFLLLLLVLYLLTHLNFKNTALFIVLLCTLLFSVSQLDGSRVQHLFSRATEEPVSQIISDASINDRFFHIYFSVLGATENFLMPQGYSSWVPYVAKKLDAYQDIVIIDWFSLGGRIMSGYGSGLFELGWFFLPVPFVLSLLLFRIYRDELKKFLFFSLFIHLVMFTAIPSGFPLFAFYLGLLFFLRNAKRHRV